MFALRNVPTWSFIKFPLFDLASHVYLRSTRTLLDYRMGSKKKQKDYEVELGNITNGLSAIAHALNMKYE